MSNLRPYIWRVLKQNHQITEISKDYYNTIENTKIEIR